MKVYLAGSIAGLTYEECTWWRKELFQHLTPLGIEVLDPMRGKEHLHGQVVGFTHNSDNCTAEEIFTRDINDVKSSDAIVVYITNISFGTAFEMGFAYSLGKKIIVVIDENNPLKEHPFITQSCDLLTHNFNGV